jgi:isocitrate/isopropylmalate dehydrogenase
MVMAKYDIAVIPEDGIGKEVMDAAVKLLEALASKTQLKFLFKKYPAGDEHKAKTGIPSP